MSADQSGRASNGLIAGISRGEKWPYVPGENSKVADARRRCGGEVGKARRLTRGARPVHQQPGEARRRDVERDYPVAVEMKDDIEPVVEAVGPHEAAGSSQLRDAVGDLGYRDGRQSERAASQSAGAAAPSRRAGGRNRR
ncbi:MAG: hypothetical protein OXC93_10265 [Rhodospirillaceae bacterium]|nr:hypothetical protein [Rhodospirillaceae bacterium]